MYIHSPCVAFHQRQGPHTVDLAARVLLFVCERVDRRISLGRTGKGGGRWRWRWPCGCRRRRDRRRGQGPSWSCQTLIKSVQQRPQPQQQQQPQQQRPPPPQQPPQPQ